MSKPCMPEGFRGCLYSQTHTLRQLEFKLQRLPPDHRAEALLGVFADRSRLDSAFADQELAGQLPVATVPQCRQPLDEILR